MTEQIKESELISAVYDATCAFHEESWKAACWSSEEIQIAAFSLLIPLEAMIGKTLLDVGCGQADFANFIKSRHLDINYKGIDLSWEMINKSKKRFPWANVVHGDFLKDSFQEKFDFTYACGAFSWQAYDDQFTYLKTAISKMFKQCREGTAISLLSDEFDTLHHDMLHYYDPSEVLKHCFSLTSNIQVDHISLKPQFIVRLYK